MKNYYKYFLICLLVFLLISLNIYSNTTASLHRAHMSNLFKKFELFSPRIILRNSEELKLSAKQRASIEAEILSFEKFQIINGADIKILELKLVSLLSKEPVNRKKMAKMIRESGKLKTNSFLKYINHLFKIKDILSKKQVEILLQKKKRFHK